MLSDENKLRIFSGNANPDLAREIAAYLGTTVGDAVINRFNNGEVQVMINESVRGKDIFIVQPTCGPSVNDNVMELLIMADAFKRASASHITAIIPYYGYARQDRKARGREPITAKKPVCENSHNCSMQNSAIVVYSHCNAIVILNT